jgi:tetratricopeptide (TPR) repeat protein
MIGHPRDRATPRARGRSRRVADVVRGLIAGLLTPAMGVSWPLVRLLVRLRRPARLALVAGAPAEHADGGGPARRPTSLDGRPLAIVTDRAPRFSTVRVDSDFGPRAYASTFAALQVPGAGKLLDLLPARLLSADVFARLAAAWRAAPGAVPRLGILLSFERWVMLGDTAVAALGPLVARGVKVEVFYAEQASPVALAAWFAHGQVVHNVAAAIATLTAWWQPSVIRPAVIEALTRLARAHSSTAELPVRLTEIAELALSCGDADPAAALACEALSHLPEGPSTLRSQALRDLGAAMLGMGQTVAGLAFLDDAIAMAAAAQAPGIGASALCQRGLHALNHGEYAGAEQRFRAALDLLAFLPSTTGRCQLRAFAHHSLAVALMSQGHDGAAHHARIALALRPDPDSHLAEQDRQLLAQLQEARPDLN